MGTPRALRSAILAWFAIAALAAAQPPAEPWRRLEALRSSMTRAGVLTAHFTQTFVPAGFREGDSESGDVWLALPDCLRWDYLGTDAKSFLICGSELHSWAPGDQAGRRFRVEPRNEAGLDLLLQPLSILAQRYQIEARAANELELLSSSTNGSIRRARITSDARNERLERLETTDAEGNVSRFDFSGWVTTPDRRRFEPPSLEWLDEAQR